MRETTTARLRDGERGAAAVEFAIILPILIVLVLGVIEAGRAYNAQIKLTQAVREGARSSITAGSGGVAALVASRADLPGFSASNVSVTSCPAGGGDTTVTANYPFTFDIALVTTSSFPLSATAVMRCESLTP